MPPDPPRKARPLGEPVAFGHHCFRNPSRPDPATPLLGLRLKRKKAIPTSAMGSTEQTFSSECQTGNAPQSQLQCRDEGRQNWLHAKQSTPPCEPRGPGRERRPKWRLPHCSQLPVWTQNDQCFASLVECVLRWSFSEHWLKNGVDPRPTTYQSRRLTAFGSTEKTFSSECQTCNVPSCSVVTKAARTGCTPKKGHSLNDKAPVEKEGQNGGFSKALN